MKSSDKNESFVIHVGDSDTILKLAVYNDSKSGGDLSPQQDASISLPPSLFEQLSDKDNASVFFVHYEKTTLFPVSEGSKSSQDDSTKKTEVGSSVVAATVAFGVEFQDLEDDMKVTVVLRLTKTEGKVRRRV